MNKKKVLGVFIAIALLASLLAMQAPTAVAADTTYTHDYLGFSLTIPSSWAGLYSKTEGSSGVKFYNERNAEADWGGYLFGIIVSVEELDLPGAWEIARSGGRIYYADGPTDVQFNYENTSLTNEYKKMEADIPSIRNSFRLVSKPSEITVKPTASTVLVNGKNIVFDAYNINDNNYFKLRDLAYTINGTVKQFAVVWDGAKNTITLTSGGTYITEGGEMAAKGSGSKTAKPTTSKVYVDGFEINLTAYNIDGNNYFKLRDIGQAINFSVEWDGARNTIVIDTSKGYTPEGGFLANPLTELQARQLFVEILVWKWSSLDVNELALNDRDTTTITLMGKSISQFDSGYVYCFDAAMFRTFADKAIIFADGSYLFADDVGYSSFNYLFDFDITSY